MTVAAERRNLVTHGEINVASEESALAIWNYVCVSTLHLVLIHFCVCEIRIVIFYLFKFLISIVLFVYEIQKNPYV